MLPENLDHKINDLYKFLLEEIKKTPGDKILIDYLNICNSILNVQISVSEIKYSSFVDKVLYLEVLDSIIDKIKRKPLPFKRRKNYSYALSSVLATMLQIKIIIKQQPEEFSY